MGIHDPPSQTTDSGHSLTVRMKLLGAFALEIQGAPVVITSQRMQVLLAYLAHHRAEPPSRQHLAFLLWPDSSETQAFTNLRTLLHRIHTTLSAYAPLIEADSQFIQWSSDCVMSLDTEAFEQLVNRAEAAAKREDDELACAFLEQADGIYAGDFLPECYDEWALSERQRLSQVRFTALASLVLLLERRRQYAAAVPYARRVVHLDPMNEAASLTLMRLHALSGDHASALRVYHTCASALQTELGSGPGHALTTAYERLLAADSAPLNDTQIDAALPLVGRDRVWTRMQLAWQTAVTGQPRLLLLTGEAGVGKTRLADDFLRWAGRQGFATAATHCYPAEGDLAYTPVATLIRSDALLLGLKHLGEEWLSEIARLLPDLAATKPELQSSGQSAEQGQRHRLFEALARVVLPNDRPFLIHFDDLQWSDRDSLEWLHFLLRFRQNARLLVVGTVRIEEIHSNPPLEALLEAMRREGRVSEIALDRLSRIETAKLAESVAGHALGPEQVDHLYAETEGNPLFIVETMRGDSNQSETGIETGHRPFAGSARRSSDPPPRVLAVIAWRLKQLSPDALVLLEVAATLGRSFTFRVLTRAAQIDETQLIRGLDELWRRRILQEHGPDAYYFTHDKLRSVAHSELSRARQRILHRRVAEALEAEYAAERDDFSGQIAFHYERAGLAKKALEYYQRAASYARQLYAYDVAIGHLQAALTLIGMQPHPQSAELYDMLGEIQHFIGQYEDARESWRAALVHGADNDGLWQANLHRKLGNAWRDQHHHEQALYAYDMAEEVLGIVDRQDDDTVWSCWCLIELERLNVLYWLGQSTELLHRIDSVQQRFVHRASKVQLARFHQLNAIGILRHNRYSLSRRAVEHARAYLDGIVETGDSGAQPAAHFQTGFTMLWATDDLDGAEQQMVAALSLAEHSGDISLKARCLTYLAVIARLRGDVVGVQRLAEQGLAVAIAGAMYDYIGAAHGNLAWVELRGGHVTTARVHGQKALEAWQQLPVNYMFEWIGRWPLIALAVADDNMSEALSHSHRLLDPSQKRMPETIEPVLEAAIRAAGTGDLGFSRTLLDQAAATARERGYL
jgi:DNA-binding SARP family transcriptional activator